MAVLYNCNPIKCSSSEFVLIPPLKKMLTARQSRQASREPGTPTLPATISHKNVSVATVSRKPLRRRRTQVVERLLAVEIPVSESRRLDRLSRKGSQLRDLLDTSGFTQRLLAVEIPVPESRRLDRPSRKVVIPAPESSRVDRPSCKALIPLPESRMVHTTSPRESIQVPESNGPSRRAFKRRGFLELSESTQHAIPILPISGRHSMAKDNLSVHSRPELGSGSVIRRIIARLWVISPFRRPRPLGYRSLLRRLRSRKWSLGDLLRSTRSTTTAQAALGTNVDHLAVRSVGTQTYPVEDMPRREIASSSENVQAAPGTNVGHVAVRSVRTPPSPVDDIPRQESALSSENIRSSDSGQSAQFLMRQAARRAQEALTKNNAGKLDKPRPQPVLKSILKKRGVPPLSEPLCGDPHRARPYTGMLFGNFEEGNVLRPARKPEEKLRRSAAETHRDRSDEEQPPEIPIPSLTGTFRVPSPSSSEASELSEVTCGADLMSFRAELEATTSNVELSRAGFLSRRADLQTTGANCEQKIGKVLTTAVEVPQTERGRGLLVETQEDAQPFDDSTHKEAGHNFERMGSEPEVELMVVDDLRFRSTDGYLTKGSPIVRAHVNSMWMEADRQVADENFARAIEIKQASLISIPLLSGPTKKGDEQDAMDTALDMVATKAVVDRVPLNAADEYLATKSLRVRAYLDSIWTEQDRRIAIQDFSREMEFHQGQTGPTANVVDMGQEASAGSRAPTIVRAPIDTYLTMIPPKIRAHVDSMWTEGAEQAAIAGFAREFAIFQACEDEQAMQ